jgi:hypothetical protein
MATQLPIISSLPSDAGTEMLQEAGSEHIWLHASSRHALLEQTDKRILVEGKGCIVKDIDGNEFIDALAGLWLVNIGHGRQASPVLRIGTRLSIKYLTLRTRPPILNQGVSS